MRVRSVGVVWAFLDAMSSASLQKTLLVIFPGVEEVSICTIEKVSLLEEAIFVGAWLWEILPGCLQDCKKLFTYWCSPSSGNCSVSEANLLKRNQTYPVH